MKRRKLIYYVCLLTAIVLNMLYVNYQFFIMLLLIILVPLMTWGAFLYTKTDFKLFLYTSEQQLQYCESLQIGLKAGYNCSLPLLYGRIHIRIQYSHMKKVEDLVVGVPVNTYPDKEGEVTVDFRPTHCGTVNIHMDRVELFDLLWLFKSETVYRSSRKLVVLPEIIYADKENKSRESEAQQESTYTLYSTDNSEIIDLRPFVAGDPLNKIHWKLSGKTDELIVREYGAPIEVKDVILVDLSCGTDLSARNLLDQVYQAAYSVGNLYVENNKKSAFMAWNEQSFGLEVMEFEDLTSLKDAMVKLMEIPCSLDAGTKAEVAFRESESYLSYKVIVVASQDYMGNEYRIVQADRGDLKQELNRLAEEM